MSESTLLRSNKNVKEFTLVDTQGNSITNDALDSINAVGPRTSLTSTPAQSTIGTTAGQALAANSSRRGFMLQNTGTTVLKLTFSSTNPTQSAYHAALSACTAADDGTGAAYTDEIYTGVVNIISSAAGGTYVVLEWQ